MRISEIPAARIALPGLCLAFCLCFFVGKAQPETLAKGAWESDKVREDVARAARYFPEWKKYTDEPNQAAIEAPPDELEVALIGDSHIMHLYPGLADLLYEKIGVFPASAQAPFPQIATLTDGLTNFRKDGWRLTAKAYETVLANPNIKVVLLGHHPECGMEETLDPAHPEERDAGKLMESAMRQSLEQLRKAGKKVLLVLDNPTLDSTGGSGKMPRSAAEANPARQWYAGICRNVAADFDNVDIVDLFEAFCDENECSSVIDGKPLYWDSHHLTGDGSRIAAPILAKAIRKMLKEDNQKDGMRP